MGKTMMDGAGTGLGRFRKEVRALLRKAKRKAQQDNNKRQGRIQGFERRAGKGRISDEVEREIEGGLGGQR
jgi:hypothetical protein